MGWLIIIVVIIIRALASVIYERSLRGQAGVSSVGCGR
jgi:hypothetical protein